MRQAWHGVRWFGLVLGCVLALEGPAPEAWALRFDGFVANKKSRIYHKPDCASGKRLSETNRAILSSVQAVEAGGFKPCALCRPDVVEEGPARETTAPPRPLALTDGRVMLVAVALPPPQDAKAEKLKFSKDIAPILNGNCMGCHNSKSMKGEFDLSTFQKMMAGSQSGEVIVPGKPEESLLVELVTTRKMPRNANNRPLADSTIEKIRQWVKEGALLDAGVSPTATLDKIAPTAAQLRMEELAKMTPEQRDQRLAKVALERWKQASAVTEPTMTSGKNFLLFGNLPESRAEAALKILEDQRMKLGSLLGEENVGVLAGPEKISAYVFNNANSYAEFVRAVERREPEDSLEAHGNLSVESPYLIVVDPLAGNAEPEQPKKAATKSRRKAAEEEFTGPERSLAGILSEVLADSVVQAAGKPPMWLSSGLGAYFASLVEPRSPYLMRLRIHTAEQGQLGWTTKANEALGDEGSSESVRGFGLSLCEWLVSSASLRQKFPMFVRGMLGGTGKLDETVKWSFGADRQQFLDAWGRWVSARYVPLLRRR